MFYKANYPMMEVKSIAECSKGDHSAILSTIIKLPVVIQTSALSILSGRFKPVILYMKSCTVEHTLIFGGYFYMGAICNKKKYQQNKERKMQLFRFLFIKKTISGHLTLVWELIKLLYNIRICIQVEKISFKRGYY